MALVLFLVASVLAVGHATAPGALKLDNYTLDKVLSIEDQSVLVKFDQSYAYGEKEDEFKALCKSAHVVPKFFIAEVPVQEYGDKENDDLRERYGLKKDDFPAFFLFDSQNKDGLRYSGAVTAQALSAWLRKNKVKMPAVGTIGELDEVVKTFLKGGHQDADIETAKKMAEGEYSTDKKAPMYVKIMQKIKEKGFEYVATETARVNKILAGRVTPEKTVEMNDKLRVLDVFATAKDEL